MGDDDTLIGYTHASILEGMRPDVAYPGRKIRRAQSAVTEITAKPCDCTADHVEVWVRRV